MASVENVLDESGRSKLRSSDRGAGEPELIGLALSSMHKISKNGSWMNTLVDRIADGSFDGRRQRDIGIMRTMVEEIVRVASDFSEAAMEQASRSGGRRLSGCVDRAVREVARRFDDVRFLREETSAAHALVSPVAEQVMTHILENAAEASVARRVVEIRDSMWRSRVRIEIVDSGTGMCTETVDACRALGFTTRAESGGTGVGLTAATRLAESVGGALEIDSAVGVGTTVRIELPTIAE